MKIRLGEAPFKSFQGEGLYTGTLSIWVRLFGCNLECSGFGQEHPSKPDTYVLPYKTFDVKSIKSVEELPVWSHGCDSSYSWSHLYKNLAKDYTEETLAKSIVDLLPDGKWQHSKTKNYFDLCFTGGEPMMQQKQMIAVMEKLNMCSSDDRPVRIQIETNGTKPMIDEFKIYIKMLAKNGVRVVFNISPKLFYVSGEKTKNAWKPEVIKELFDIAPHSCLKYVVNLDDRAWNELIEKNRELIALGVDAETFIMPVGATKEQQEDSDVVGKIANRAIENGYHVSGRLHSHIFGNGIGT